MFILYIFTHSYVQSHMIMFMFVLYIILLITHDHVCTVLYIILLVLWTERSNRLIASLYVKLSDLRNYLISIVQILHRPFTTHKKFKFD